MSLSMYQASVPVFVQILTALSAILDKAAAYAAEKKINPNTLLTARLYPNMFTLTRQIQTATDHAKGAAARLAGVEVPKFADEEKTFDELKARIAKTLDFIGSVPAAKFDGSEERTISLKVGPRELSFKGLTYLFGFALPNFFFHATTAYDILRHNGLDIGKSDFIGKPA
ncbi:MAG: DUF1993 domain-containing protein [Alphaproteobacteria bacterium]|nr:DUF1993 domain-containing protein [Alphaproteobacteria bacterium]